MKIFSRFSAPFLFLTLCAAIVAACTPAGPTGYGPALGVYGYTEKKLDNGAWKVSFTGNRQTGRKAVEAYALYRAAQLTQKQGATRFMVIDRSYERDTQRTYAYRTPPARYVGDTGRHGALTETATAEDSRIVVTERRTAIVTILPFTKQPARPAFPIEDAANVIQRLEATVQHRGAKKGAKK